MVKKTLGGEWRLRQSGESGDFKASVPGCVHLDLLANKRIEDPFFRDNELTTAWVSDSDWIYSRSFEVDSEVVNLSQILLRCEGLDTFAEIRINDKVVGKCDNMFRTWEFDVKHLLRSGGNTIEIRFTSPTPYIKQKQEEDFLWHTGIGTHRLNGGNWVRKEQCQFGWDWGPKLPTMGIWRDISLLAFDSRLADLHILQHRDGVTVNLGINARVDGDAGVTAKAVVTFEGEVVASAEAELSGSDLHASIQLENPKIWWPNGMGAQPLYEVRVELHKDGRIIDTELRRIGIRELGLVREKDQWGESFCFAANGVRFFSKGANWIPADSFDGRISYDRLRDLLESARDANMNFIRVWGGGKYECDAFYDICDELGLCVWQDFMFACSAYPAHVPEFMENVRAEAEDNVTRLRHHACIGLWCGNNELEQIRNCIGDTPGAMNWAHYCALFDDLLSDIVMRLAPGQDYWPSSEHSPIGDRHTPASTDPRWGDAHLWKVWHGREPFEWYRTAYHRFCSEFGFQSFPEPATVATYTDCRDRNITSYVMELHQRSPIGNSAIMDYGLSWFRLPVGFDNTLWLSQIIQVLGIQYAVEHWRRNMPRCMGAIYWQLNDCWPVASWSSIDYLHRWKALQYAAKRFFAPVLLSTVEDKAENSIEVHLSNDRLDAVEGTVHWQLCTPAGAVIESGAQAVTVDAGTSLCAFSVDAANAIAAHTQRGVVGWFQLEAGGSVISRSLAFFSRPKHLDLEDPQLSLRAKIQGDQVTVEISAANAAYWAWISHPTAHIRWDDNFMHLQKGEIRTLKGRLLEGSLDGENGGLRGMSLFDTFKE